MPQELVKRVGLPNVGTRPFISKAPPKQRVLRIPKTKLPMRLQYLKPYPTKIEIDLDKLNPLIQDPMIKTIECHGESESIIVQGNIGRKATNIMLTRDEINNVLQKFSQKSKIPLQEGVIKIVLGTVILSAIISDVVSSKFIITKMTYNQNRMMKNPNIRR